MLRQSGILVLDTHAWVWLVNGNRELKSSSALDRILEASRRSALRVSAVSVWEVGMLEAKGRLSFAVDCVEWGRKALSVPGIGLIPITPEIALASSRLPGTFHGDPADRLIIATARDLRATLVTKDKVILDYGSKDYVETLAV